MKPLNSTQNPNQKDSFIGIGTQKKDSMNNFGTENRKDRLREQQDNQRFNEIEKQDLKKHRRIKSAISPTSSHLSYTQNKERN